MSQQPARVLAPEAPDANARRARIGEPPSGISTKTAGPLEATFSARDLDQAMALAKRALGPDALIVSSRRIDVPGRPTRFEVHATLGGMPEMSAPAIAPDAGDARLSAVLPRVPSLLERVLRDNDVPAGFAREIAEQEGRPARSLAELRTSLCAILRARVGFGDRTASARIVALVGPTGVGKTTTIAKLAARDALLHRRRVVLVSMDDYRVGGADQLASFADLIGVPFAAASDPASLAQVLAAYAWADRIYVDTAGRSPRDHAAMERMAQTLASAGAAVALAIPANARSTELGKILQQHAPLAPCALVVTKLDEAELVGGALLAALSSQMPIAHFTTGQRVPEDIEAASAEKLTSFLLGEGVIT